MSARGSRAAETTPPKWGAGFNYYPMQPPRPFRERKKQHLYSSATHGGMFSKNKEENRPDLAKDDPALGRTVTPQSQCTKSFHGTGRKGKALMASLRFPETAPRSCPNGFNCQTIPCGIRSSAETCTLSSPKAASSWGWCLWAGGMSPAPCWSGRGWARSRVWLESGKACGG